MRAALLNVRRHLLRLWSWLVLLVDRRTRATVLGARAELKRREEKLRARFERELDRTRRIWCANNMGNGFSRPTRTAGTGYFWKQDQCGPAWRLYRKPVRGW